MSLADLRHDLDLLIADLNQARRNLKLVREGKLRPQPPVINEIHQSVEKTVDHILNIKRAL